MSKKDTTTSRELISSKTFGKFPAVFCFGCVVWRKIKSSLSDWSIKVRLWRSLASGQKQKSAHLCTILRSTVGTVSFSQLTDILSRYTVGFSLCPHQTTGDCLSEVWEIYPSAKTTFENWLGAYHNAFAYIKLSFHLVDFSGAVEQLLLLKQCKCKEKYHQFPLEKKGA